MKWIVNLTILSGSQFLINLYLKQFHIIRNKVPLQHLSKFIFRHTDLGIDFLACVFINFHVYLYS